MGKIAGRFGSCTLVFAATLALYGLIQVPNLEGQKKTNNAPVSHCANANPNTFIFKGLRLYMTPAEAIAAMEAEGLVHGRHQQFQQCAGPRAGDGISCPELMEWSSVNENRADSFSILLWFVEALPESPNTVRLQKVEYEQKAETQADARIILSAIVEKYGSPTIGSVEELQVGYGGLHGDKSKAPENVPPYLTAVRNHADNNVHITLEDPSFGARSRKLRDNILHPPIQKPTF